MYKFSSAPWQDMGTLLFKSLPELFLDNVETHDLLTGIKRNVHKTHFLK